MTETQSEQDAADGSLSPVVVFAERVLRPGGEIRRQSTLDGELVLYVRRGGVYCSDSVDASDVIRAGAFARIPARLGRRYALRNESATREAQVFEVGVSSPPQGVHLGSGCEQRRFTAAQRRGTLCVVASADGQRGSLRTVANMRLYSAMLLPGQHLVHERTSTCRTWLRVVEGALTAGDIAVVMGDGIEVTHGRALSIRANVESELLLVDLG